MDISWLLRPSELDNKENFISNTSICASSTTIALTSTTTQLNNISLNSNGVLTSLNPNSSFSANQAININDSFDCDKIKFDVYEKSIQKLADENKNLRIRVKNLQYLARSKQEQLLDAFNQACEDKRKNEEKNQIEHNAQLQSYYECFLQIEKENDSLKIKLEQMKSNMAKQQDKIENLTKQINQLETTEPKREETESEKVQEECQEEAEEEQEEMKKTKTEELNKISKKHIDEEFTELNKTINQFIQDKKAENPEASNQPRCEINVQSQEQTSELLNYKTQRISELELDLETLNKKLASIEASLARWIFRACDYKSDLTKLNEKLANYDQLCLELEETKFKLNSILCIQKIDSFSQTELNLINKTCQTEPQQMESIHTQTESSPGPSSKLGLVAQQAAKLNQIINENQVKSIPNTNKSQPASNLNQELTQLKLKVDNLILEKNSFKVKNDELIRELDLATQKLENLKKEPVESTNVPIQVAPKRTECKSSQTKLITLIAEYTQTQNIQEENNKLDELKKEYDLIRSKFDKKLLELEKEKHENINLKSNLDELNTRIELLKQENDTKLNQIITEFNKKNKVSDTIIQQQKKLLDHMQLASSHHHHNIKTLFQKKKIKNSNPLLANLQKTTNQNLINKQQEMIKQKNKPVQNQLQIVKPNIKEIEIELNSNYITYSELNKNDMISNDKDLNVKQPKQIHVFITGLNTCPTYCHVCQKLIPLIAYASKCQLCSFTCHSTCSSINKARKSGKSISRLEYGTNQFDPLKYCNINYLLISLEYNNYINKLINLNLATSMTKSNGQNNTILLSDWVYVENNSNKWKKLWLSLRIDESKQEAKLDIYQTKTNLKPFDTINLIQDKIQIETNIKQINKISNNNYSNPTNVVQEAPDSIYEELNEDNDLILNLEKSSLIILLHNSNRLMLKLGFNTFNKKNIWYDALLSSILIGRASSSSLILNNKKLAQNSQLTDQFKLLNLNKVLKPFLELCDTIVNSYCFINDNLIALACDDGLYALNSYNHKSGMSNNISLVKIDKVESAHKLYYENEFGKLCFIGRKSRQFLSIDVNELNTCLINNDYKSNDEVDYEAGCFDEEDEEAKSVMVTLEHIHNIDRCHLFECKLNKSNGYWYLAVATPETIYILLFNKITNKYTLVKTIQTQSDSPCLCIKFTNNFAINQLVYGCGKDFFKMDISYLQSNIIQVDSNQASQQPIAVCVLTPSNYCQQEALLLCYETHGVFMVFNFNTNQWQLPVLNKQKCSSSSSISSNNSTQTNNSSSNLLQASSVLKWPRGNGLTPLQIEYDSSFLYLFYNDSIIVYQISFEGDLSLSVKKCGITFVYKPRYLNMFNNKNSNCIIISNRRPMDEEQIKLEEIAANEEDSQNEENENEDKANGSSKMNDPLLHDLNDKICLSYFSPGSN